MASRAEFDDLGMRLLGWSFPLGSWRGLPVRVSWTLLLAMLFPLIGAIKAHDALLAVAVVPVVFACVLLHALGHLLALRLVHGRCDGLTLWALGEIAEAEIPPRPWPHLLVGLAGIAVSGLMAAGAWAWGRWAPPPAAIDGIRNLLFGETVGLVLWNLLACQPFDGSRWWRALLWGPLGLRRACIAGCLLAYASALLLLGLGLWGPDMMLFMFGILTLIVTFHEWLAIKGSYDPVLPAYLPPPGRGSSWFTRWRQAREHAAAEARVREEQAEDAVLDRLLAKVSEQGLPSLSADERRTLQRISERQRQRDGG